MSQVKQAEKTRKRSPLLPVLGLLIAITVFVFSYAIEDPFVKLIQSKFPQAGLTPSADPLNTTKLLFTFGIWLVLLTIFSTIVAVLGGKTPNSGKDLIMPPRTKAERDKRYGGDTE